MVACEKLGLILEESESPVSDLALINGVSELDDALGPDGLSESKVSDDACVINSPRVEVSIMKAFCSEILLAFSVLYNSLQLEGAKLVMAFFTTSVLFALSALLSISFQRLSKPGLLAEAEVWMKRSASAWASISARARVVSSAV